jgi:hypothetical protein
VSQGYRNGPSFLSPSRSTKKLLPVKLSRQDSRKEESSEQDFLAYDPLLVATQYRLPHVHSTRDARCEAVGRAKSLERICGSLYWAPPPANKISDEHSDEGQSRSASLSDNNRASVGRCPHVISIHLQKRGNDPVAQTGCVAKTFKFIKLMDVTLLPSYRQRAQVCLW